MKIFRPLSEINWWKVVQTFVGTQILVWSLIILVTGCMLPLKGGKANFQDPSGLSGSVQQPQNPKDESTLIRERVDGQVTEKITIRIGAAQKDVAREMGAKLASMKGIMWVGVAVFLFGAASLFYPPLKLIIGSATTSMMAIAAGLALMILPTLIVGNEILILAVSLGAVGLYYFSHRHGKLQGFVDENKDGIDDRKRKL